MAARHEMTFRPAPEAFDAAIAKGVFSINPHTDNYAGRFMYMHTDAAGDHFKNINTRQYIIAA